MLDLRSAKQVFLKLLLAGVVFLGAVHGFRLLLLPAIQSVFQPGEAATSLLRRSGILLFAVLAYWAYVRLAEKRAVRELRPAPLGLLVGALGGVLLILCAMLLLFAVGAYEMTAYRGLQPGLWNVAGLILVAAVLEEIAFRGFLFGILESAWGSRTALWLQALVFSLVHIGNIEQRASTQELVTTIVGGLLVGAFWGLVYLCSRNLWVAAVNHAAWNFTIILAGLPLSGLEDWRGLAPLASEYRGPAWLTGGVFGPEDSLVTIALTAVAVLLLLRWARARQRLVRIPPRA